MTVYSVHFGYNHISFAGGKVMYFDNFVCVVNTELQAVHHVLSPTIFFNNVF